MTKRFATSVACATTALVLLGSCSDDNGPTILAKGEDVGFVGGAAGLSDQTMDITAEEDDGEVSGEVRFSPAQLTLDLQCADTDADGIVIVGGQATADSLDGTARGAWVAVAIREGDPDGVGVWFPEDDSGSCQELLEAFPDDEPLADATADIETG